MTLDFNFSDNTIVIISDADPHWSQKAQYWKYI